MGGRRQRAQHHATFLPDGHIAQNASGDVSQSPRHRVTDNRVTYRFRHDESGSRPP